MPKAQAEGPSWLGMHLNGIEEAPAPFSMLLLCLEDVNLQVHPPGAG